MALPGTTAVSDGSAVEPSSSAVAAGVRDSVPVALSVIPFGIAIGAAISESAMSNLVGWAAGPLVFAGSAHLAAITLLGEGAAWLAVVTSALVVNVRLLLYSATLSPLFHGQPRWFRWTAPHLILDETFALVFARKVEERENRRWFRAYLLASGVFLGSLWITAVAGGILAGPVIPESWPVEFAAPAALAGLLAPAIRGRPSVVAALVGAVTAVALRPAMGSGSIIVGAALGMLAGILMERFQPHASIEENA